MEIKRYKPMIDRLFYLISLPTAALMIGFTVLAFFEPSALFVVLPVDVLVVYFLISPLFGYVELRGETVFIKFGFFMSREIPYAKIRGASKSRRWYSDSMMSLKNAMEHVNIKYNTFDMVSVSVVGNDELIDEILTRRVN